MEGICVQMRCWSQECAMGNMRPPPTTRMQLNIRLFTSSLPEITRDHMMSSTSCNTIHVVTYCKFQCYVRPLGRHPSGPVTSHLLHLLSHLLATTTESQDSRRRVDYVTRPVLHLVLSSRHRHRPSLRRRSRPPPLPSASVTSLSSTENASPHNLTVLCKFCEE